MRTLLFIGRRAAYGFTIVELLVTIVIVSILASACLPMAELAHRRGKEEDLRHALRQIRDAIDAYHDAAKQGHILLKPGESGYPRTLDALVEGVTDVKSPTGEMLYFLRRLPRDPFNDNADIAASATWGKRSYASSAADPKEGMDVYDIYSLSVKAGVNGIPYRDW